MSFLEDLLPVLWFGNFGERVGVYSDSLTQNLSQSMANIPCGAHDESERCRDDSSNTLILKLIAIAAILIAGFCGVTLPLVGKKRRFLRTDSKLFVTIKAFAAGVILATGFVHMLPDATEALTDSCLPKFPWSKFPFSGFIAMMAALATLLADFIGTQYYEQKQERESENVRSDLLVSESDTGIVPVDTGSYSEKVFGEEESGSMHIVGIHAHAAHHGHSHAQEQGACRGRQEEHSHGHSHSHGIGIGDEDSVRHIVVSQILQESLLPNISSCNTWISAYQRVLGVTMLDLVSQLVTILELGIVSHSVIIGLSLGVSHSPCTIRPLIGALSFHQFFEGFALGGCISQARFATLRSTLMACFFGITTPLGIAVGIGISSIYNANSPRALVIEGVLDSISAGILVYMALVDLIAADFLSKKMSCNLRLQVVSYFTLFLGAALMSSLAIWA